jgi:hypothetical protein
MFPLAIALAVAVIAATAALAWALYRSEPGGEDDSATR